MTPNSPENKIYLTYKTRMTAEAKLRATGRFFNILITWYSFCLIIISLSEMTHFYQIPQANFIFTSCSIGIFGLSLFASGERYFEKADQFRNCYLELQALYQSTLTSERKMQRYAELLKKYDNQSGDDFDDMLFDAWTRNQGLEDATGPVRITYKRVVVVIAKKCMRYGFFIALITLPLTAMLFGHSPIDQSPSPDKKQPVDVVNEP
jgi:SMODS and SLOG-associating 2TM effector domain family 5